MSETMKFEELDIRPEIFRAVQDMGFEEGNPDSGSGNSGGV